MPQTIKKYTAGQMVKSIVGGQQFKIANAKWCRETKGELAQWKYAQITDDFELRWHGESVLEVITAK